LKLPHVEGDLKLFMECELRMLVFPMSILPKTRAERVCTGGSIFQYA
jgi:hypothetical protein